MGVINTGLTPSFLLPLATKAFGDKLAAQPTFYDKMYDIRPSDRAYEEMALVNELEMMKEKPEGTAIAYSSAGQGYMQRFLHVSYALGFVVTEEAVDDLKSEEIVAQRAGYLAISGARKREAVAADIYNTAFSATYADGVALIATTHPSLAGNQSNTISVAADFSEAAIEQLQVNMLSAQNNAGRPVVLTPKSLIIPPALLPTASRVLESELRSGTADHDLNWSRGRIPEIVANPYLSSTTAYFVRTDAPDGMIMFNRKELMLDQDTDFDTSNRRFKGSFRMSVGPADWRGLWGVNGP